MSELQISKEAHLRGTIVRLAGDAGMHNVARLNAELNPVVAARPQRVVLNLSGLTMIGSLGMGAVIAFRKALERNGGMLFLTGASPLVLDAFTRARLTELFVFRASEEDALSEA